MNPLDEKNIRDYLKELERLWRRKYANWVHKDTVDINPVYHDYAKMFHYGNFPDLEYLIEQMNQLLENIVGGDWNNTWIWNADGGEIPDVTGTLELLPKSKPPIGLLLVRESFWFDYTDFDITVAGAFGVER